ncbi:hypothetical protein U1Q18_017061 [Sarracenia purpurea var. burkii]
MVRTSVLSGELYHVSNSKTVDCLGSCSPHFLSCLLQALSPPTYCNRSIKFSNPPCRASSRSKSMSPRSSSPIWEPYESKRRTRGADSGWEMQEVEGKDMKDRRERWKETV